MSSYLIHQAGMRTNASDESEDYKKTSIVVACPLTRLSEIYQALFDETNNYKIS
jgi:hypothetical protein